MTLKIDAIIQTQKQCNSNELPMKCLNLILFEKFNKLICAFEIPKKNFVVLPILNIWQILIQYSIQINETTASLTTGWFLTIFFNVDRADQLDCRRWRDNIKKAVRETLRAEKE